MGYKTYSKSDFTSKSHPRDRGGSFKKNPSGTEDKKRKYHYDFNAEEHDRGTDGSFAKNASEKCVRGIKKYGSSGK